MIYGISDVHGDLKQAIHLLKKHDVIDEDCKWKAGTSTLVCVGDSTDRGNNSISVLKLFYSLKIQAFNAGGRVIHLMGNHDALILSMVLHRQEYGADDYERSYVFQGNGGKPQDVKSLEKLDYLRRYMQSFPLMCRVDDILFQHADGFEFYQNIITNQNTPEDKIKAINLYGRERAQNSWGAWNLFFDITDERRWQHRTSFMPKYLELFDAKQVVHGHTGFLGDEPLVYLDNQAINIDAVMSRGYRNDENRGCVLVIDSPGDNILL